jgi:hypothetical protein
MKHLECASLLAPCVAAACCRAHEIAKLQDHVSVYVDVHLIMGFSALGEFLRFRGEASFAKSRLQDEPN